VITNHHQILSWKEAKMERNIFSLSRGLLLMVIAVVFLFGMLGEAKAAPISRER